MDNKDWKKKIFSQIASSKTRYVRPYNSFMNKIQLADNLLEEIKRKIKNKELIKEAKFQFIISNITAFEVYFRELFLVIFKLCTPDTIDRCKKILNIKFTLENIIDIYLNKIEISEFISNFINFQKLEVIDKIFSSFIDGGFFNVLKGRIFKSGGPESIPFKLKEDFHSDLRNYIELRHKIVHDVDNTLDISDEILDNYHSNFLMFIVASDIVIHKDFIEIHLKDEFKK